MVLRVEVVQSPQGVAISEASKTISEQGGSLGRGDNNTWVLPDPDRFLSSRHCEFDYDSGRFYLTDVSTNGTFVNGAAEPLGRGVRVAVNTGDTVEIGEYQFALTLEDSGEFGVQPASSASNTLDPFASPSSPFDEPLSPMASGGDSLADFGSGFSGDQGGDYPDLGSSETDPLAALDKAASDPFSAPGDPFNASLQGASGAESFPYGQNSYGDGGDAMAGAFEPPQPAGGMIPEDWEDDLLGSPNPSVTPAPQSLEPAVPRPKPAAPQAPHRIPDPSRRDISQPNRVLRKAARPAQTSTPPTPLDAPEPVKPAPAAPSVQATPAAGDQHDALISAMGLDPAKLSAEERAEIALTVGELMPVVIEGMMRVLRSRASIKNEFRMSVTTIQPVENNPLKFSADTHEAMENMFVRKSKAYKAPVNAFAEGFDAIAEHQVAIIAGIRAAFSSMVQHFDPTLLEQQFDKQSKGVVLPGMQKARYWTSYNEYFQSFMDNMEQSFQNLFGDEFVRAYEDQLFKLMTARNSGQQ